MGRGVVSLLDDRHTSRIEALWAELEGALDMQGLTGRIRPHISYHVADSYRDKGVQRVLNKLASEQREFSVRTTGLGLFSGEYPALYLTVTRSPDLSSFHEELCRRLLPTAHGVVERYSPENWVPHITLASAAYLDHFESRSVSRIVAYLNHRPLNWEISIDNFAVLRSSDETGGEQEIVFAVDFGGAPQHQPLENTTT